MRNTILGLKLSFYRLLRKLRLLQFIDSIKLQIRIVQNRKKNKRFLSDYADFSVPPYHLAYDAYNHVNWQTYFDSGKEHARFIASMVNEYVPHDGTVKTICEWGCGPGRVIRHLHSYLNYNTVELYGTDYNEETVHWCQNNIQHINFAHNGLEPPLPFDEHHFDCIYAISVFTHLSERMHYAWIRELFRILKPTGIIILTTHGDNFVKFLSVQDKKQYDVGELIVSDGIKEGKKWFHAVHSPIFMKNGLLKDYAIVRHITDQNVTGFEQDVWVVRNPEHRSS